MEVVLDLGRPVLARYTHGDEMLSSAPLTSDELHEIVTKVGNHKQPKSLQCTLLLDFLHNHFVSACTQSSP